MDRLIGSVEKINLRFGGEWVTLNDLILPLRLLPPISSIDRRLRGAYCIARSMRRVAKVWVALSSAVRACLRRVVSFDVRADVTSMAR